MAAGRLTALFEELLESVKQAKAIERGELKAARVVRINPKTDTRQVPKSCSASTPAVIIQSWPPNPNQSKNRPSCSPSSEVILSCFANYAKVPVRKLRDTGHLAACNRHSQGYIAARDPAAARCAGNKGARITSFSIKTRVMDFHFRGTELALWSTACAVFGWLVKSHFSSGTDVRKQNFRAAIATIRDQFGLVRDEALVDAHAQSLPRIREECAKIRNDLGRRRWDELNEVVTAYSGLTKNDIENRKLAGKVLAGAQQAPEPNYGLGRSRLDELLNELIKIAE